MVNSKVFHVNQPNISRGTLTGAFANNLAGIVAGVMHL
jgi:hypothetical protein